MRVSGAESPLRTSGEGGFTIIEMMVAISLMTLAMVALTSVFLGGLKAATASSTRTAAASLATKETEAIRAVPYEQVGLYSLQTDFEPEFELSNTVILGTTAPAGVLLEPTSVITVGPVDYEIRRHIIWVDAEGFSATSTSTTYTEAYKKSVTLVEWKDGNGEHTVRQESVVYPGGLGAYAGPGSGSVSTPSTIAPAISPGAPNLSTVTTALPPLDVNQLDLTWTAPTSGGGVSYYVVERATDASFTSNQVSSPQLPSTATAYSATGLAPSTTYHFRVTAYASATLASPASNVRFASTGAQTALTCNVASVAVTGATSGATTKLYLQNGNSRLRESLNLAVSTSGDCTGAFTVAGVRLGSTNADPGSPFALGGSSGSLSGTIPKTNSSWSAGVHKFTVQRNGVAVAPVVEKSFLFCAHTNSPSSNPSAC